jgi:hypothetical protein
VVSRTVQCRHAVQAQLLRRYQWLSHRDRSVITLGNQAIGPTRASVLTQLDRQSWESPMRFDVVDSSGTVQTFSRFNPLVYFCPYGHESFYECLQLSLRSLAEYGSYCGTVGVACDRSKDDLIISSTSRRLFTIGSSSPGRRETAAGSTGTIWITDSTRPSNQSCTAI